MAVGMLMMVPGASQEMYDSVNEKMFGSSGLTAADAPDGLIVHTAGPAEGGWYVYDVWESREHFERFANERLMPALKEIGAPQAGDGPQFYEIANLLRV